MLTTARPIFEHVPASFADPVGLADQQAPGVVSLIVVRYETADGQSHDALGPFFDAYVAASGQLLAVARTTADYRYPVTPSTSLARFIEHRDGGAPATLSLYELSEDQCARFLETVFFSECLKLHVDGAGSAPLVAHQIARSGCGNGILEVNDFSDPAAPRVRLVDLDTLAASVGTVAGEDPGIEPGTIDPTGLAAVLRGHLDGVVGRVLLYDREKNRAALPHRSGRPFDLDAAIAEANRLALARRGAVSVHGHAAAGHEAAQQAVSAAAELRAASPPDQVDRVEAYLSDRTEKPRLVAAEHPHATGLAALVAEFQGIGTAAGLGGPSASLVAHPPTAISVEGGPVETMGNGAEVETGVPGDSEAGRPLLPTGAAPLVKAASQASDTVEPTRTAPASGRSQGPRTPASAPTAGSRRDGARHVLATELDVLRADVYALFEDAVGRERAVPHEAHVLESIGVEAPVPPDRTVEYLRALLTTDPPKRWHFFKRQRGRTYEVVCAKLLAFHSANGHVDDPVIHEVNKLWARLCK